MTNQLKEYRVRYRVSNKEHTYVHLAPSLEEARQAAIAHLHAKFVNVCILHVEEVSE